MERRSDSIIQDEVDIGVLLREMYRWKLPMLAVPIFAGVVVAGFTLTLPNVYESTTALIIREPSRAISPYREALASDDSMATLSVEALQSLSESSEITQLLFERLWKHQALEKWQHEPQDKLTELMNFLKCLSTELKTGKSRTGGSATILPILVLKTRAESTEEAMNIANEWALVVLEQSRKAYTGELEAMNTFVSQVYDRSDKDLARYETQLADKVLESSLDQKKNRLTLLNEKLSLLNGNILDLDTEIKIGATAIAGGRRRILEQQVDGEWIGTVAEYSLMNGNDPFDKEEFSPLAQKILTQVRAIIKQTKSLRDYRETHNLLTSSCFGTPN